MITGSDCGALRQQRARLMEENERLRKLILSWANDINWAAAHAGCQDKFSPITESMKNEALCKARPLLKS